jgi:sulfur-carrier protein adenylyltransferase/sulfurtransferase
VRHDLNGYALAMASLTLMGGAFADAYGRERMLSAGSRFGANVETTTVDAAFLWLGQPPLPADYPETSSELRALAVAVGDDAVGALDQAAFGEPDYLVAILGATGRGGPGLIGVKAPNPKHLPTHPRSVAEP